MLTPKIITFVYWLGCIIVVITAIVLLFSGEVLSAIAALISVILVRIYCELMIVAFKINESLQVIRER
jgi:hypothetical protein